MSILSLCRHTKEELHIYIMTSAYSDEHIICHPITKEITTPIETHIKTFNDNNTVTLIDATEIFTTTPPLVNIKTRFTPMCMLRLYSDLFYQIPSKILYLDYDVICTTSPDNFYNTSIDEYDFGGVTDNYGKWFFYNGKFKFNYVNSGVLLLNMNRIRNNSLFEKCRNLCNSQKMFMPDQSALNKLSNSKLILPRKYNEQKALHSDTVFRHFSTTFKYFPYIHTVSVKPWQKEKVHNILKTHKFDSYINQYEQFKKLYLQEN